MRVIATLVLTSLVTAQQGSFTNYGRGCNLPSSAPPLIRSSGVPRVGARFTVTYTGPNGQTPVSDDHPILLTGIVQAAVPIPQFSSLQPANCTLLVLPVITTPMPWTGSRYQDQFTFNIPLQNALVGGVFNQQFLCLYSSCRPSCVPLMVRMSDGGMATIGL